MVTLRKVLIACGYTSHVIRGTELLPVNDNWKESKSNVIYVWNKREPSQKGQQASVSRLPCSLLHRRFGVRVIAICGSLFLTGGLLFSAFVTSLIHLYITYGLLAGTGAGMLLFSGTCAINLYFNKGRQLAVYLATSGLSVGSIFYPVLLNFLIDKYGWRGTFICVSAIASHTVAAAMLLKDERRPRNTKVVLNLCEQDSNNRTPECQTHNVKTSKKNSYISTKAGWTNQMDTLKKNRQRTFLDPALQSGRQLNTNCNFSTKSHIPPQNNNLLRMSTIEELYNSRRMVKSFSQRTCFGDTKSVYSNFRYLVFTCGETYVVMLVYFIPFLYLPNLVTSLGSSDSTAAFLITVAGMSSLTTRIVNAIISNKIKINLPLLNGIGLITGGVLTFVCTFLQKKFHLFLYATYLGIFTAITSTVQSLIVREIVGLELFSLAWGYTAFTAGIMAIVGPPLAGRIADVSGGYSVTFQYAGGMFIIAGLSSVSISVIKRCRWKTVSISRK